MMNTNACRQTGAFAALILMTLFAGCGGTPDYEPSQRQDTSTIELPANKGLEFKLFMREGDSMQYTWRAAMRLPYDFHGERDGDNSGACTTHKTSTAGSDSGSLTAPFTGTHGWYWENQNAEIVTITLTTDGIYDLVGESPPVGRGASFTTC